MRSGIYRFRSVVFVLTWVLLATKGPLPGIAQDPNSQGTATFESLQNAYNSGGNSGAVSWLRSLPNQQRPQFLSSLHQMRGDPNGGGAIADYSSLIQLIESTIDGNWASQGGESQLTPYRNGVRIDPKGVIERFDPSKETIKTLRIPQATKNPAIDWNQLGEWQEASGLRWVSLHQLDTQIAERMNPKSQSSRNRNLSGANISMELMGGLYRIDYVAFDPDAQEWLLGGPAGNLTIHQDGVLLHGDSGLPPILLEDLLSIAPHVLNQHGEFGCTIDPDPTRLNDAYNSVQSAASKRALQRDAERWMESLRQKLGRQRTKVIGLEQDSPTGYALIVADAHMKRLGLDLEHRPSGLKSYWHEREVFGGHSSDVGLVRWWFALTDHKIPMDPERKIYHFAESNVRVMSEAQMMDASGSRSAALTRDFAAESFAKSFGHNFDDIQKLYPCYGRLRHIFDLAVALEIVRVEMRRGNGKPFQKLTSPSICPSLQVAPSEIDSVAATRKQPDGSITAIVSGGVTIDLRSIGKRMVVDRTQTKRVDVHASFGKDATQHVETQDPLRDRPFWR